MIEREKQVTDQQKKHADEKERHEHPHRDGKVKPAGMTTDPEAAQDKAYVQRIDEKTQKH